MLTKSKLLAGAFGAAAAVASAGAVAAEAGGSIYGDFRYGLSVTDSTAAGVGRDYDFNDNRSYLGLTANTSAMGVTAFLKYERDLANDTATSGTTGATDFTREAYAGLKGGFGTVKFGQMATAYQETGEKLDPFFNTGATSGFNGLVATLNGAGYGLSALTNDVVGAGFIDNQIAYVSPSFSGITVNAAFMSNEGGRTAAGDADDPDMGLGAEFNADGITAGLQYLDINFTGAGTDNFTNSGLPAAATNTHEAARAYASYATSGYGVGLSFERLDLETVADQDYLFASGWVGVAQGTRVAASVGHTNDTAFEGLAYTVGVFHDIIPSFTTHVAFRSVDGQVAGTNDNTALTLGASYKFDFGFAGKITAN